MKPTIGRIVHYQCEKEGITAAIITAVEDEAGLPGQVALELFGNESIEKNINFIPFSEVPKNGHWNWPPKV